MISGQYDDIVIKESNRNAYNYNPVTWEIFLS